MPMEENCADRQQRRRARVEAIALYAELTLAYRQFLERQQPSQAAELLRDIELLRERIAILQNDGVPATEPPSELPYAPPLT